MVFIALLQLQSVVHATLRGVVWHATSACARAAPHDTGEAISGSASGNNRTDQACYPVAETHAPTTATFPTALCSAVSSAQCTCTAPSVAGTQSHRKRCQALEGFLPDQLHRTSRQNPRLAARNSCPQHSHSLQASASSQRQALQRAAPRLARWAAQDSFLLLGQSPFLPRTQQPAGAIGRPCTAHSVYPVHGSGGGGPRGPSFGPVPARPGPLEVHHNRAQQAQSCARHPAWRCL